MFFIFVLTLQVLFVNVIYGEECVRNGISCPNYTVLQTYEDYEERHYQPLMWVSTSAVGKSRSEVSRPLFKTLYEYLSGENEKGQLIDMMVPVRTTKISGDDMNNYTISIAITSTAENFTNPINPLVTLKKEPATTYVTRSFGGRAQENEWDNQAQLLKSSVIGDEVDTSFYFWCVYDPPWTEDDRLNEVWMRKIVVE